MNFLSFDGLHANHFALLYQLKSLDINENFKNPITLYIICKIFWLLQDTEKIGLGRSIQLC